MEIHPDAECIIRDALRAAMPGPAVTQALARIRLSDAGRCIIVAVGKAAWEMARAAGEYLGSRVDGGVVITKYGHAKGCLNHLEIFEAGHPIPDENGYRATARALEWVEGLNEADHVLFLLSGGGSALFEQPRIPAEEMADITRQLLACGANIVEINTVRKRLSAVKGGRFALRCMPAQVVTIVLSDIIGDPLDMIASGPTYPDATTCEQALAIRRRYQLRCTESAMACLSEETPKTLSNVTTWVVGNVKQLSQTACDTCRKRGYDPRLLTTSLDCEAREAGAFLAAIARDHQDTNRSLAFIAGGETVVHLTAENGLGGRNQEIALRAAQGIAGCRDTWIFSLGSDGTDGPTDAAGGIVNGTTAAQLAAVGIDIPNALARHDAYHALNAVQALIRTGPTGTNVNDLSVVLIKR